MLKKLIQLILENPSHLVKLIQLTGFTFFFNILVLFLLLLNDQLLDILYHANDTLLRSLLVSLGVLNFSLTSWFTARLIIWYCVPGTSLHLNDTLSENSLDVQKTAVSPILITWLPRFYALLTPLCAAIFLAIKAQWNLACFMFLAGTLAFVFTIFRRQYCRHLARVLLITMMIFSAIILILAYWKIGWLASLSNPGFIIFWGLANVLLGLTILAYTFHLFIGQPHRPAKIGLLVIGISLIPQVFAKWIAFISGGALLYNSLLILYGILFLCFFIVQLRRVWHYIQHYIQKKQQEETLTWQAPHKKLRTIVSFITILLIGSLFLPNQQQPFFTLTENHQVPQLIHNSETIKAPYASMKQAWDFYKQHLKKMDTTTHSQPKKRPVLFVLSQGGGLRAGYWSNVILQKLKNEYPDIDQHIFMLSGVSGGSVGNAFYIAHVNENTQRQPLEAMEEDHLSRVTISFLYNDLLFRFFPLSLSKNLMTDRARYLQISWEKSSPALNQGLRQMYLTAQKEERWLPLWLSMGTLQETGQRVVTSPVTLESDIFPDVQDYFALNDYHLQQEKNLTHFDISLSAAALNAARFPYITPPGALYSEIKTTSQDKKSTDSKSIIRRHILDGGYFDNFGSEVIQDWLRYLTSTPHALSLNEQTELQPVVIIIDNNLKRTDDPVLQTQRHAHMNSNSWILREITSPLQGLIQTRSGHTIKSIENFNAIEDIKVFRFSLLSMKDEPSHCAEGLPNTSRDVPLGWWLSETAEAYMKNIDTCKNHENNRKEFTRLKALFE